MERKTLMRDCYPQKEEIEAIATDILGTVEDVRMIALKQGLLDEYKAKAFGIVETLSDMRVREFYPKHCMDDIPNYGSDDWLMNRANNIDYGWGLTHETCFIRIMNEVLKQSLVGQYGGKNPHIREVS